MPLLARIEAHLRRTRTSATRFGLEAIRDPRLVHDLRCGRRPRRGTVRRIEEFLDARQGERRR
jgi:hypothetical protein